MEIVAASQHMLFMIGTATGAMFGTVIVATLAVAFIAVQIPWKFKALFLLALANEIRGVAVATPFLLALFHH